MHTYSVFDINAILKGEIAGQTSVLITAAEQLEKAAANEITFIGNHKYEKLWTTSRASIAVVNKNIGIEPGANRAFIKVENADLAMSQVLTLFAPPHPILDVDIHKSAIVDETAVIEHGVKIGANCYIGPNVKISADSIIYPNVTIFDNSQIGTNTVIWSGTVIRERTIIGNNCILHPNSTIGADGFGFRADPEKGLVKMPQIGHVIIGNNVEIGANSCVDRGKFSATIIGDGCKIDNLVQIGHNSVLGKHCILAGNVGIAGSVYIGNGVVIGGSASIKDHITIGDGAKIGAGSGVITNIPAGQVVLGYPAIESRTTLKQWAILKRLVQNNYK